MFSSLECNVPEFNRYNSYNNKVNINKFTTNYTVNRLSSSKLYLALFMNIEKASFIGLH